MIVNPNPSKYTLVEVPLEEDLLKTDGGILLPGAGLTRSLKRSKAEDGIGVIDVADRPRDNFLWGEMIHDGEGEITLKQGTLIYFNKFDADEIPYEGKRYFRINNLNVLGYEEKL